MRSGELGRWIGGLERMVESIAQRPLVVDLAGELARQQRGEAERNPALALQLLQVHLLPHLRAGGSFEALSIVDATEGRVLVSTDEGQEGRSSAGEPFFEAGLEGTFVGDVRGVAGQEALEMHLATPIGEGETPHALLIGRVDLHVLDEIASHTQDDHETEDVFLVNGQGLFVTGLRSDGSLRPQVPATSEGISRGIAGETAVATYESHRGTPVLGAFRWLPEVNLALIAEIDQAEVVSLVSRTRLLSYGLIAAAVIIFTILSIAMARRMTHPIRRVAAGAARVGRGEFDHRIASARQDELGDLARAFDQMTENLQRITTSRDELQHEVALRVAAEGKLRDSLAALHQSERLFRLLTESSPIGICIWQGEHFAYVNPALERILGYTSEELVGRPISSDLISAEDRQRILQYVNRAREGSIPQTPLRVDIRRKDGSVVSCEGYARAVEFRNARAVLATIIDTTLLREAEERFRLAAQVASDLIYEWDVASDTLTWYGDIDGALGCKQGEIEHTIAAWVGRIHPEDQERLSGAVERHRTTREPIYETYRIRHEDGSWRHWIDRAVPLFDPEGAPARWIGVCIDDTERVRTFRERVESEERFRRILDNAPDIIYRYRLHPEPRFEYISGAVEQILGYRPDEIVAGQDFGLRIQHPDEKHQLGEEHILSSEGVVPHSHRWVHKDGRVVWVEDVHVPVRGRDGHIEAIEGIARDISERIEAEVALRTADDIVHTLPTGILILRPDESRGFVVERANPEASHVISDEKMDLDGKSLRELFAPEMVPRFTSVLEAVLESGQRYDKELVFRSETGIRSAVHLRVFKIPDSRLVAALEDITLQKQAEERLQISEQKHRSLFENASLGIYQTTPDGRILAANPALVRMLGYESFEDLAQRNLEVDGYEPETPRESFKRRLAETGRLEASDSVWTRKDGRRLVLRENAVAVKDDEGNVILYEGTVEDITAQREAEEERERLETRLRQSQKLESIGTLASGVAHEINNPLTGMINYAELISRRVGDPNLRNYAEAIMSEGGRVAKIVRNLLSFARQERETHSPARLVDIYDAAISLIGQLLRKDHILVEADVPDGLPSIKCRSQQIQQVLLNLLTNARDALNDRYVREDPDKRILIRACEIEHEGSPWIRMTVEDRGIGIAQENAARVFDPFFTTKPRDRGTGLGLSISYGIVRDHGGRLMLESEPGQFTRFTMDLPVDNGWTLTNEGRTRLDGQGLDRR